MIRTIGRYGARHVRGSMAAALKAILHGDGLRGPSIAEFEKRFADYHGMHHAISASYGRMAFYYILKSLNLPRDSEIIFPALTFWVVPEMARVLGFRPKFVDIDPATLNIDPVKMEAAITPNTRVVVPTHLYGQPCEMEPITAAARTHGVFVIEDCAHAQRLTAALAGTGSVQPPSPLPGTEPVYYQSCIRTADPHTLKHRAIRA